jgi:RNA polymerase sigma factor (TIGR02999 family)
MSGAAEGKDLTGLLNAWAEGDQGARDALFEVVYPEIKAIARRFRSRRGDLTLQATEVVHETYLRLLEQQPSGWRHRAQFFKLAAQVVRQVVVDSARRRGARKRGGDWQRSEVQPDDLPVPTLAVDILSLDEALERLAQLDPETAQLVELRYFAGLTIPKTAEVLGIGTATVSRRWQLAQTWLRQELSVATE